MQSLSSLQTLEKRSYQNNWQRDWGKYRGEGHDQHGNPISLANPDSYQPSIYGSQNQRSYSRDSWRGLAERHGPYWGAGAAAGGLGGAALGRALFGRGGAAVGGLAGAGLGAYLGHRYQQGHFKPLFQKGGVTLQNLGKALWGSSKGA